MEWAGWAWRLNTLRTSSSRLIPYWISRRTLGSRIWLFSFGFRTRKLRMVGEELMTR